MIAVPLFNLRDLIQVLVGDCNNSRIPSVSYNISA